MALPAIKFARSGSCPTVHVAHASAVSSWHGSRSASPATGDFQVQLRSSGCGTPSSTEVSSTWCLPRAGRALFLLSSAHGTRRHGRAPGGAHGWRQGHAQQHRRGMPPMQRRAPRFLSCWRARSRDVPSVRAPDARGWHVAVARADKKKARRSGLMLSAREARSPLAAGSAVGSRPPSSCGSPQNLEAGTRSTRARDDGG